MPNNADGVYKRKDRPGYWISWRDAQGRRRWRKTNALTLTQARNIRAGELLRVEQSRVLGFNPPGEDRFSDVAAAFLAHQKPRLTPLAYERERGIIELHVKPFFNVLLKHVRKLDVQRYVTKRCADVSGDTVRKELNVIKHIFKLALEWELLPINPALGVKAPKAQPGRVRYLQPTELRLVIDQCPEWLRPIVALASLTGMRRSELLRVRWLDVDLNNGRVFIPKTKNGDGRIIYLNKSAVAVLNSLERGKPTDSLFPNLEGPAVSMAFVRVCRGLQIFDFRFHDLRHTAASWLRMSGADIHTVAQLLGHKDLRMAARYQHLSPEFLAEAVHRLDGTYRLSRYQGVTTIEEARRLAAAND
jgi:integrase